MTDNMSYNLGVVLMNLARYADQIKPDMIVVHGAGLTPWRVRLPGH